MSEAISRSAVLEQLVLAADETTRVVAALGFISRDLYALTETMRHQCFYCLGSMGSVTPLALGIALAQPSLRVIAVEGDGSLLMNLGTLVTLRRYGTLRMRLIVIDNGCYESTGGQPSQPPSVRVEDLCTASDLSVQVATTLPQVVDFLRLPDGDQPHVLVVKTLRAGPAPRIPDEPRQIARRFATGLDHEPQ